MSRSRMIKPCFWSSRTLQRVSRDARLLFIGLWNFADDYGVLLHSPRQILGDLFPFDESVTAAEIKLWISELCRELLIVPVWYRGQEYLVIRSWNEHQKVNHPSRSTAIPPDEISGLVEKKLQSQEYLKTLSRESQDALTLEPEPEPEPEEPENQEPENQVQLKAKGTKSKENPGLAHAYACSEEKTKKKLQKAINDGEHLIAEPMKLLTEIRGVWADCDPEIVLARILDSFGKRNPGGHLFRTLTNPEYAPGDTSLADAKNMLYNGRPSQ